MINFLNLEYFLVAAEELNFTRAAKRLYISQQSLSNHISNLEKEFDVILFNRTTPLTLTYAGEALRARARQLLDIKDETFHEIADIKDFTTGQLSIGVSHTRGRNILPAILPLYKERFPNIDLKLVEGNSKELDNALLHSEVDLIIDLLPFRVDNVEAVPICNEEILLAVPNSILEKEFPDQTELDIIKKKLNESKNLSPLANCPYLLINKGNGVRAIADEVFADSQFTPNIVLETENIETVMALAAKGMGITFYPKMFIKNNETLFSSYSNDHGLSFFSLTNPKAHGVLAIGYHKGHYMSQATKEFINIVKETLKNE